MSQIPMSQQILLMINLNIVSHAGLWTQLEQKYHFDESFVTGFAVICHSGNFLCNH